MKLPSYILPILVLATLFSSYVLRNSFTQPTTNVAYAAKGEESVTCIVRGVKCKGTANFFTKLYDDTQGIASIETFASDHRVVFTYDPAVITPDMIRQVMEAPIPLSDGTARQLFVCESME